jgi:hypothetical protein
MTVSLVTLQCGCMVVLYRDATKTTGNMHKACVNHGGK